MTAAVLTILLAAAPAQGAGSIRRFALLIGANQGGPGRQPLRYAQTDASAIEQVLRELGGLVSDDEVLVFDPTRPALQEAFNALRARAAAAVNAQRQVILYYSGHSDADGLLLSGGEHFGYQELRAALDGVPAEVRIAILDSCASGNLTRLKGGTLKPSFLVDQSSVSRGHAFLTSSSAEEAAQESDQIGSSFFTHYLVSGLRGAADVTGDGRITLLEAYQYAFRETLQRTEATQGGPQHPAYAIDLVGTGDLVMTDLRGTAAGIRLEEGLRGRVFVRDQAGHLVAELHKPAGRPMELALAPGTYQVELEREGQFYQATVSVPLGPPETVAATDLVAHRVEATRARGGAETLAESVPKRRVLDFSISLVPPLAVNQLVGGEVVDRFELSLVAGYSAGLDGAALATAVSVVGQEASGAQLAGAVNVIGGTLNGAQLAGAVNVAGRHVHGAQLAGALDVAGDGVDGVQAGGAVNVLKGGGHAWQLGGAVNVASGPMSGAQLAGAVNVAGDFAGAQISVLNFGSAVRGLQLGVINVASESTGTQIGVVNVSGKGSGLPVGLFNFAGGGRISADAWYGDLSPGAVNVGVKLGVKHFYSLITAGIDPTLSGVPWELGGGLGGRVDVGRFFFSLDLLSDQVSFNHRWEGNNLLLKARLTAGYAIADRFSVFLGISENGWFLFAPTPRGDPSSKWTDLSFGARNTYVLNATDSVRLWPSPYLGIEF